MKTEKGNNSGNSGKGTGSGLEPMAEIIEIIKEHEAPLPGHAGRPTRDNETADDIADFAGSGRPDRTFEKEEAMMLVRKKIMELEPRGREIVILKLEHGRSYKEIAEIMGISVTNVGLILHTAMKKLVKEFNSEAKGR
ncbi:MAG TPA: hypothetical protein DET40_09465 [Lentisphaeria bacterium]|nr:MAG: hypothetical protein A2X45_08255 [Lentisphaerae bacterium GWF2_50_93]HCE43764.1 hypothetical protein [Lentisphaeria bacterium]